MTSNPQYLIDLPGYGSAQKELRKAWLWDDCGLGEKTYLVNVFGTQTVECSQVVLVSADNPKDAIKKATRQVDFDVDGSDIVTAIKEATE